MSLPAFLINLENRHDRLEFSRREASLVGLEFHVVPAVTPDELEEEEVEACRQVPARIACWKSHVRAWECAQEIGANFSLILEDDVRWLRNPQSLFREIEQLPPSTFDALQLGSLQRGPDSVPLRAELALKLAKGVRAARVITRQAERIESWLVERSQLMARSLDQAMLSLTLSDQVIWDAFGSGTHAYVVGRNFIPSLVAYNSPPFLAADDALSALAHQGTFRIGQLRDTLATQAFLLSDLR